MDTIYMERYSEDQLEILAERAIEKMKVLYPGFNPPGNYGKSMFPLIIQALQQASDISDLSPAARLIIEDYAIELSVLYLLEADYKHDLVFVQDFITTFNSIWEKLKKWAEELFGR